MNDHEVDGIGSACGYDVSTSFLSGSGTVIKGDGGVEPDLGYPDDSHLVIHFNDVLNAGHGVVDVTGDLILQSVVAQLRDKQDPALFGYFVIVHDLLGGIDEARNIGGSDGDVSRCCSADAGGSSQLSETVSIDFGNDLSSNELAYEGAEGLTEGLFVQCVIAKAFYPLLLMVSHKFSIPFHPCGMSDARGDILFCYAVSIPMRCV